MGSAQALLVSYEDSVLVQRGSVAVISSLFQVAKGKGGNLFFFCFRKNRFCQGVVGMFLRSIYSRTLSTLLILVVISCFVLNVSHCATLTVKPGGGGDATTPGNGAGGGSGYVVVFWEE